VSNLLVPHQLNVKNAFVYHNVSDFNVNNGIPNENVFINRCGRIIKNFILLQAPHQDLVMPSTSRGISNGHQIIPDIEDVTIETVNLSVSDNDEESVVELGVSENDISDESSERSPSPILNFETL